MVWQQEHRLIYEDFLERYRVILYLFAALFVVLGLKLFSLQVIRGNYYRDLSEQQRTHIIVERAPRGDIYDRNGTVLVGSKTAFVAIFYPFSQGTIPTSAVIGKLHSILDRDLGLMLTRGWRSGKAVRLADDLNRTEMFRLQEQRLVLPGISVVRESRRDYPVPEATAHLVGYLNEITPDELDDRRDEGYKSGDWIGRGGLEQVYDSTLRGQDGGWQIEVDAAGRQTRIVRYIQPVMGNCLHTAIDAKLQNIAAKGLAASPTGRGAVVALDPRTGAVRCLVSSPAFDPNAALVRDFGQYLKDKRLPLFNRTVQALYPPGSTFKIVTFSGAVDGAHITPDLTFFCPGSFTLGNKSFSCWLKKGHGRLDLIGALANSCNVYFYQLGLKIGPKIIENYARMFHLGEKTGIDLTSEKKGLVPSEEWKLKKMRDSWQQGDTVNIAIGQGPLWVTPVQMASLISTVANGGTVWKPYIVEQITAPHGEEVVSMDPEKVGEVRMSDTSWQLLHKGLEEVVSNGTGRGCLLPGLKVAGKTGTAQNPQGEDHAWFVCYAPAEDPQIAIAVIVENGGHGGTAAVPIARSMLESYFEKASAVSEPAVSRSTQTAAAARPH